MLADTDDATRPVASSLASLGVVFELPRRVPGQSTAAACFAALSTLLHVGETGDDPFGRALGQVDAEPMPNEVAQIAKSALPVKRSGPNVYQGGLGMAALRDPETLVTKYVVLLGRREGRIRYYCPHYGCVLESPDVAIDWQSPESGIKRWALALECEMELFDIAVKPRRHVFVIAEPNGRALAACDPGQSIVSALSESQQTHSCHRPVDAMSINRQLFLSGQPVLESDMVWLMPGSLEEPAWRDVLSRLSHVDAHMLNPPQAILYYSDHRCLSAFKPAGSHYSVVGLADLARAWRALKARDFDRILLRGTHGAFYRLFAPDTAMPQVEEAFGDVAAAGGGVLLEGIRTEQPGGAPAQRALVTTDTVLAVFPGGECYCTTDEGIPNVAGANALSVAQRAVVERVQAHMAAHRVFLTTIDFLGDSLLQVDAACPGGACPLRRGSRYEASTEYVLAEAEKFVRSFPLPRAF